MNKLRDQFFQDCTIEKDGIKIHNLSPHNTFEWFKNKILILIPDFATYLNDHYDFYNITSEGIMYYNPANEEINSLEDIFDEWIKDIKL